VVRKMANQPFALKHDPHGRIAQPGGVTRRDDCFSDVKMVAMCDGQAGDNDASWLITWPRIVGKAREFLEQRQRPELQRVQIERVPLWRHLR